MYSLIQAQRDAASSTISSLNLKRASSRPAASEASAHVSIPSNIKGKDLFDSILWKDPVSTSVFYTFIASLRKQLHIDKRRTTPTHRLIRTLRDNRKLVRCYTQNIDGLESRLGLCTDLARGKGTRTRFTKKSMEKPKAAARLLPGGDLDGGCEVVQLHGDLDALRCTLCQQTCPWEVSNNESRLLAGKAPTCQSCIAIDKDRQDRGKRGTRVGTLRPNIVLYGEEHPSADAVGAISAHDLALSPDTLLILGTSLHVHGLKVLVKEFAKSVHARANGKGKVIFVNLTRPTESMWRDVIDYWVSMDCDEWVATMKRHRPGIFQVQEELQPPLRKLKDNLPRKNIPKVVIPTTKIYEDKENRQEDLTAITTSSPKAYRSKAPLSPRKKAALQEHTSEMMNQLKRAASRSKSDSEKATHSQLPTPPTTGRRANLQAHAMKRSLAANYQDFFASPSKKRKHDVKIFEDSDSGPWK